MTNFIAEYNKYFTKNQFTRLNLFEKLKSNYNLNKVLYLGSYIHITPSLVFPEVVYVDSYKKTKKLLEEPTVPKFIEKNKLYPENSKFKYIQEDYTKPLCIKNDFDLLISQYAGFVSQAGKQYLKTGGILIANNSHGDASMANLDSNYQLIAVANHTNDTWRINSKNLDTYFIPKSGVPDNRDQLQKQMKRFSYTHSASNYIFKKIK